MRQASSLALVLLALLAAATIASTQQIHLPPAVSQGPGMANVPVTYGDSVQKQQAQAANQQRRAEIKRHRENVSAYRRAETIPRDLRSGCCVHGRPQES
jgi:hypothetical protein